MKVSVVVPTYRRPGALRTTLQALVSVDYPNSDYEVIVVDDGSDDETPQVSQAFGAPVRYLRQEKSGVAKARNLGASIAQGDFLIFVDDDIIVKPDHIARHLDTQQTYGECLVNGPWVFSVPTLAALQATPFGRFRIELENWVKTAVDKQPLGDGRLRPSDISAQVLGVRASLFRALGGFDEAFPFAGCEDQDFSYRAQEAGYTFVFDPALLYDHNDERVDIERFCGRQRRGAHTFVYFVERHPEAASRSLLLENCPISRFDPWPLRLKKLLKSAYASTPGLAAANALMRALEHHAPESRLLQRVYRMTIGAHIFLGIREGLADIPGVRAIAYEAMRRTYATA